MSYGPTMHEILDSLRKAGGDDWHVKLAQEMTEEDKQKLSEAFKATQKKSDDEDEQ